MRRLRPMAVLLLLLAPATLADEVKGDWNGDGKLTSVDALAALKMAKGSMPADLKLDLDGDGKVTERDADLILAGAVGRSPPAVAPAGSGTGTSGAGTSGAGTPPPPVEKVLKGLWGKTPPAWTPDGRDLVMPALQDLQILRIRISDGRSETLISSLPATLGPFVTAAQKGIWNLLVEGDHVLGTASGQVGGKQLRRVVRVPLAGGPAEDLGDPPPFEKWWEGIPGDWLPIGLSADETTAAVVPNVTDLAHLSDPSPIHVFRLPDRLVGKVNALPADRNMTRPVAFSPDGKILACALHQIETDSSTPHRLVLVWTDDLDRSTIVTKFGGWAGGDFSFSPDGRSIAIQIEWDDPSGGGAGPRQEIRVFPVQR